MSLFNKFLSHLSSIYKNKWFQYFFQLLALVLIILFIIVNGNKLLQTIQQIDFNATDLSIAALIIGFTVFLGGISWHLILLGFGYRFPIRNNLLVFFKASLAKYIPGTIWQFLSKGQMLIEYGVPSGSAPWILVWEFLQILWTGVLILAATASNSTITKIFSVNSCYVVIRLAVIFVMLLVPTVFLIIASRKSQIKQNFIISSLWFLLSTIVVVTGWVMLGVGLIYLLGGFGQTVILNLTEVLFAYTTSVVSGILAVPVPNGVIVREGVLANILSPSVPIYLGVIVGSSIRILIAVFEFLFGGVSLIFTHSKISEYSKKVIEEP